VLATEFRTPVHRQRVGRVPFDVRPVAEAVEHVVSRDVADTSTDETRPLYHVPRAQSIDPEGVVRIELTAVDVRPRPGVDDGVGHRRASGLEHRVAVGDIEALVRRGDDVVAGEHHREIVAERPCGAGDEDSHEASPPNCVAFGDAQF